MADNYTALKSSQKKRYISKETFNSLDLSQIPVGSEYEVVSPIEKGDLSADINNALNKADNALPKPTNDTTGSAGQVLKKTANGSEWGDAPSGGGKLYRHNIYFYIGPPDGFYLTIYSNNQTAFTPSTLDAYLNEKFMSSAIGTLVKGGVFYPIFQISSSQDGSGIFVSGISSTGVAITSFNPASLSGSDTVYEV